MIDRVRDDISDTASTVGQEISALGWLIRTALMAAVAGAIYQEMRKPPEERTWEGRLLGFVPYDFRLPTIGRIREAYWNPHSTRIFSGRPIGVGWAVNLPAVLKRLGVMQAPKRRTRGG